MHAERITRGITGDALVREFTRELAKQSSGGVECVRLIARRDAPRDEGGSNASRNT